MNKPWLLAVAATPILLVIGQRAGAQEKNGWDKKSPQATFAVDTDAKRLEGLWRGSWGGGEVDGAIRQPVVAEMLIKGKHVELIGFPDIDRLMGTVHFDANANQMQITPTVKVPVQPAKFAYEYQINGNSLTLIAAKGISVYLQREFRLVDNPLANVKVECVLAEKISVAGDLVVTRYTVQQAGRKDITCYRPVTQSLSTKNATIFLVQDSGLKKVTLKEARRRIQEPTPVVVTFQVDDRRPPREMHKLSKDMGVPQPDSKVVSRTLSRILRPGTLIFVLSPSENRVEA